FPAVLTLRATYLPFDPVNYGCGLLRVRWWPYFTGSLIGMLPPMLTFVSFGASVEFSALAEDLAHFHPLTLLDASQLAVSAVLLLLSAVIVVFAERHRRHLQKDSGEED
ncbi:MAG: VTT domain-containing protein, partial [Salinisphaera sp.]|nr:VTT domain-containing protein [Salinisphaera sp.]